MAFGSGHSFAGFGMTEKYNNNDKTAVDRPAQWQVIRGNLRERFGDTIFQRWLEPVRLHPQQQQQGLILSLPTLFMAEWVDKNYGDFIRMLWRQQGGLGEVRFIVMGASKPQPAPQADIMPHPAMLRPVPAPVAAVATDTSVTQANPNWNDLLSAPLDPRFTFENFVVGKSNELAYAAARRVAEASSTTFNPLFLYGGVGLGKTHLMHAIAWHIRKTAPQRRVIYLSAEKFMYQFVRALRVKDTVAFKDQFRSVDILMIDDVQFIGGREQTQEEFFHTFNALVDQNHQVVVSADRSPQDLDGLEERLKSRLGWGLCADLHQTTYDLRLNILASKAAQLHCAVPAAVTEFLAQRITASVRELEGALNRLVAHAQLMNRAISLEMTQEVLADILRATDRRITIDEIQRRVCEHFNIKVAEMHSARRARPLARPRQVAMYLAKQLTPRSLPEIGRKFGGRDHTTVIHAVRRIEELMTSDPAMRDDVEALKRMLQG